MADRITMSVINLPKTKSKYDKYDARVHKALEKLWSGAILAFVEEASVIFVATGRGTSPGMHIETGMSAASLVPVIDKVINKGAVAGTRFKSSIVSQILAKRTVTEAGGLRTVDGSYLAASKGYKRTFEQGLKYGKRGTTVSFGTKTRPLFKFYFDIQPYQWSINEAHWTVLENAQTAFNAYIEANVQSAILQSGLLEALVPVFDLVNTRG